MDDAPSSWQLADLRRRISSSYNLQDLQLLAHDLGVEYDNLSGSTLDARALALIQHFRRRGQLATLTDALRRSRPNVEWPVLLPAAYSPAEAPYLGLLPFTEGDKDRFFGRRPIVAKLVGQLRAHSFVALIGSSGNGKSSLLRAGLLPALKSGQQLADGSFPPPHSERWAYELMSPSLDPLERLAMILTPEGGDVAATRRELTDAAAVPRLIARLLTHRDRPHLLLIVDQFEEVFTLTHDEASRAAFVAALLAAARAGNASVLVAFRADFYDRLQDLDGLGEAVAEAQVYLPPMSRAELRRAIEGPAALHGLRLEEGFAETLLRDLSDGPSQKPVPGALPLLSHVLLTTWNERGADNALTHAAYREAGGVLGAVEKTAARTYGQLSPPEQATLRRLLTMRLSTCQEGVGFVRRRATLAELQPADPAQAPTVERVIAVMADAKLLTTGQDEAGREIVELAHEVLLTAWQSLREWLVEDNQTAQLVQEVIRDAREWHERGRAADELYRGGKLAEAASRLPADLLGPVEQAFLAAGQAAERHEQAQRRQQRLLMAGAALLLVGLAVALTIVARRTPPALWEPIYSESGVLSLAAAAEGVYFGTKDGQVGLLRNNEWQIVSAPGQRAEAAQAPEGSVVEQLAADPQQPGHLYAAIRLVTIYASADGGQTWAAPEQALPVGYVIDLTAYDGRVVAVFSTESSIAASSNTSATMLLVSADGGRSWSSAVPCVSPSAEPPPADINAVHFGPEGELFVGGSGGFYQVRQNDGCWQWSLVTPLGNVIDLAHAGDELLLLVRHDSQGTGDELYRYRPGQEPERIGAWDEAAYRVASMPDRSTEAATFVLLETGEVQSVATGRQSAVGRGPSLENALLVMAVDTNMRQLLLAHDGGLSRYRQAFDRGGIK